MTDVICSILCQLLSLKRLGRAHKEKNLFLWLAQDFFSALLGVGAHIAGRLQNGFINREHYFIRPRAARYSGACEGGSGVHELLSSVNPETSCSHQAEKESLEQR